MNYRAPSFALRERAAWGWHAPLLVLLGLALGGLYFIAIDMNDLEYAYGVHARIIAGDAGSPYRYRVLVPLLLEGLSQLFGSVESHDVAFLYASAVYDCAGLLLQVLALYALLRQWFTARQSLIGVVFTSGVTVATFGYFSYQPWSILEVAFFSLGLLLAYHGRWLLAGLVVLLASLNRETGVFLPLALVFGTISLTDLRGALSSTSTRWAVAWLLLSVGVFGALRLLRGGAEQAEVAFVLKRNLLPEQLIAAGIAVPVFFGLGWLFAVRGVPHAPPYIRAVALVLPFYLLAFVLWGWWRETRILTTLYPLVVPMILAYCYAPTGPSSRNQ